MLLLRSWPFLGKYSCFHFLGEGRGDGVFWGCSPQAPASVQSAGLLLGTSSTAEAYAVAATRKKPAPRDNDAPARRAGPPSSLPLLVAVPKHGSRPRK